MEADFHYGFGFDFQGFEYSSLVYSVRPFLLVFLVDIEFYRPLFTNPLVGLPPSHRVSKDPVAEAPMMGVAPIHVDLASLDLRLLHSHQVDVVLQFVELCP